MKEKRQLEKEILDVFYKEAPIPQLSNREQRMQQLLAKMSPDEKEFADQLSRVTEKMHIAEEELPDFELDTLSIIEQGAQLREKKSARKEFVGFLFFAMVFLTLLTVMVLQLGMTVWVILQLVMIVIVPWLVIPVLALKRKAGEV